MTENGAFVTPSQEDPGKVARDRWLEFAALLIGCFVLAVLVLPSLVRPGRRGGSLTACKSNLENMGTALEMYSTDYVGKYPTSVRQLTPNYLKTTPECPAAGYTTYRAAFGKSAPYNTQQYEDYYFIECVGNHHGAVSVPANYPQYNGIVGLMER